jgi:hypothetical protein
LVGKALLQHIGQVNEAHVSLVRSNNVSSVSDRARMFISWGSRGFARSNIDMIGPFNGTGRGLIWHKNK